ncbi:MAG: mechanosensitive ion channel family protein [Deltaproteobacteria bacterium]|nr:mechanosensitive ion channel family protein [Deltaproteobacteria bacterium]MBW2130145.1 mechanosensitive ion channel family protein [Deltaproteobacteria bacterium]
MIDFEIAGNSLWHIISLFAILLAGFLGGKIARLVLLKTSGQFEKKQKPILSIVMSSLAKGVVFLSVVIAFSIGQGILSLGPGATELFKTLTAILVSVAVGYLLYWLVEVPNTWLTNISAKTESRLDDMIVPIVRKSLRFTIVILVLVQIAQLLSDKPITSIIAGLGIGGLAVALAAQDTIKNIFGSIILFADKPFQLGDRIVVDGHDGPVEEVGLRSTRIRTLDGHLVTVPNGELANKTIRNIGKRPYIRRIANITITYDTPPEKVDRALEILREILDNHEGMHPDYPPRVYFSDFNAESLNLMVIYWYHPPNYWDYMAFSERFNREVLRRFNEEGIEFAFPTQTLYLAGDPSRPLTLRLRRLDQQPDDP